MPLDQTTATPIAFREKITTRACLTTSGIAKLQFRVQRQDHDKECGGDQLGYTVHACSRNVVSGLETF